MDILIRAALLAALLALPLTAQAAQADDEVTAPAEAEAVDPHRAAMQRLSPLIGHFDVTGVRYTPEGPVDLQPTQATVTPILDGYGLRELSQSDMGMSALVTLITTLSYDPHRKVYRVSALDDTFGVMDIYEGRFVSESVLSVTNLKSDTYFPVGPDGDRLHFQLRWDLAAAPKRFDVLMTQDGGASWAPFYEMVYSKVTMGH